MTYSSRLPKIEAELAAMRDMLPRQAAEIIKRKAKDRVAVDTGRLQAAIHIEKEGVGEYAVVAGDNEAFYGHIVEHGGAHTPARPFLVPALEESLEELAALTAAALRRL